MTHLFLTVAGVIVAASFVDLFLGVVATLVSDVYGVIRRAVKGTQRCLWNSYTD
jgi:hypothetical protein